MEIQWVQEPEVGLRVAPSERSTVLSRARIGTAVDVVEASGTWRRIRLLGRPSDVPVEGWVVQGVLGGRVRSGDLWAAVDEAEAEVVALEALERALSLDGTDAIRWAQLGRLREALDDSEGAAQARRRGLGEVDMWVAVCDGDRVELAARIDPTGAVTGAGPHVPLESLAVSTWYRGEEALLGTPFATPFRTNSWNEPDPSPWRPAASDPIGETTVVLGPCSQDGAVYSTLPLSPRSPHPGSVSQASAVLETLPAASRLYGLRVRSPVTETGMIEVQLEVETAWMSCGGVDPSRHQATGLAVLDAPGDMPLRFGGPWFDVQQGNTPVSATSPRWFSTPSGGLLIVADASWYLQAGVSVALERSGSWTVHHQPLRSWGC